MPKKGKPVSCWTKANLSNKAMLKFLCVDGEIVHVDPICCYESEKIRQLFEETNKGEIVHVDPICCYESEKIRQLFEETDNKGYIDCRDVPIKSIILSVVNDFCISRFEIMNADYADHLLVDMLQDFNVKFIQQQPPPVLVQLICAAYELRIKSLLDMTHNAIDEMLIYGRSANEILKKKGKSVFSTMPKKGGKSTKLLVDGNILSNKAMFRFHCLDGKIVHVDPICCCESEKIHQFLTDELAKEIPGDIGRFPIMAQILSNILSMVNDFCITRFEIMKTYAHRDDNLLVDMLQDFNVKFIQQQLPPVLVQLKCAAYELRIKSLFDLTSNAIAHKIDGNSSNKAMLRFRGVDEKIFHVDPRCCYESDYVREMLIQIQKDEVDSWMIEEGDIGRICYVSPIPSDIFSMVNDFCISRLEIVNACTHDDNCLSDLLGDFDCRFVQKQPPTLLVQLMDAAYNLRIQSLMDVTRNAIVDKIDGKSAEEILRIFNMPDFTHKAWVERLVSEPWGHKRMIF